jgi:hypothetical protein
MTTPSHSPSHPSGTADLYQTVNSHYSALARSISSPENSEVAQHSQKVALSFGYDADELAAIPEGANLGVSCGNPLAIAGLRAVRSFIYIILMSGLFEGDLGGGGGGSRSVRHCWRPNAHIEF